MRILAIRGQNLASLDGPFEVDLAGPVLGGAGLVVICGPTGAGKSTLLDAMCLALFGDAPRLGQGARATIPEAGAEEGLGSGDARCLLRRGAAEGFAEVDFLGQDGHRYRARWSVHRARRRPDGRLQDADRSLRELETDAPVAEGKKDTAAAVVRALGLDGDQFRRAVLLAQGEFAAFLRAGTDERAELLARVTGTGLYRDISRAAHRRRQEAEAGHARLAGEVAAVSVLPSGERAALEAEAGAAHGALAEAEARQRAAEAVVRRLSELDRARLEEAESAQALAAAERAWSAALAAQADTLRARLAQEASIGEAAHTWLREHAWLEPVAARWEAFAAEFEHVLASLAGAEENADQITALEAERQRVARALEALRARLGQEEAEAARWEQELTALRGRLEGVDRAAAAARRQALEARRRPAEGLEACARRLSDLAGAQEAQEKRGQALAAEAAEIARRQRVEESAQEQLRELRDQATEALRQAEAVRSLDSRRAELVPGEPCPLCGSTEHPWTSAPAPAGDLDDCRRALADIEADHDAAVASRLEREASLRALDSRQREAQVQAEELARAAAEERARFVALRAELAAAGASPELPEPGGPAAVEACAALRADLEGQAAHLEAERQGLEAQSEAAQLLGLRLQESHRRRTKMAADARVDQEAERDIDACLARLRVGPARARALAAALAERLGHELGGAPLEVSALIDDPEAMHGLLAEAVGLQREHHELIAQAEREVAGLTARLCALEAARLAPAGALESAPPGAEGWLAGLEGPRGRLEQARAVRAERRRRQTELEAEASGQAQAGDAPDVLARAEAELRARGEAHRALGLRLAQDDEARRRIAALDDELGRSSQAIRVWQELDELIGHGEGLKLQRLAQGLNLDLLAALADAHLRALAPRFRLQRAPGDELGLLVLDADLGDELRGLQSLSGGEGFLVSLALALGLSGLNAERAALGSLFVDEGFGSLDADSLQLALAALEALQAGGCQVVIISHVPELAERISHQVRVEKVSPGRSRVLVRGPGEAG